MRRWFLRRWRDTSLKNKLLASYILVMLVPMILLSAYEVSTSRQRIIDNASSVLTGLVEKSQESFARKIEQLDAVITFCTYDSGLQKVYKNRYFRLYDLYLGLAEYMTPVLNSIMASNTGDVDTLLIYSNTGLQPFGSYLLSADAVADEAWYQEAINFNGIRWHLRDDQFYATCRIDPVTRLYGREPMGVLYLKLRPGFLSRYLEINWPDYHLAIHGPDGGLLYEDAFGTLDARDGALTFTAEWPRDGWQFLYTVPLASILAQDHTMGVNFALILGSLAVLTVLVLVFSRTLLRGVKKLQDTMTRVQAGDLNIVMRSESRDEVGLLTEAFDTMLSSIRSLIEQTKENERAMSDLSLRALRAQIDPHFLYNTLSYINWKAVRAGQMEISHAINQLSIFYRTCLNKGMELTSVGDEIANTRAYLEIQLLLHNSSFDVVYDVPDAHLGLKMPNLILQPLIENAIVHGIDQIREGRGRITVSLWVDQGFMVFAIADNGPGAAAGNALPRKGAGYGLTNVNDRIRLHYGGGYGVSLDSGASGGCTTIVRLPASDIRSIPDNL